MKDFIITNYGLLKFMADKHIEPAITVDISTKSKTGYLGLAKTFKTKGKEGDKIDIEFYNWLKNAANPDSSNIKSEVLEILKLHDPNFDVFLKNKTVNQKWHLFISWYAYKEFYASKHYERFCEENGLRPKLGLTPKALESCVFCTPCGVFQKWITCPELYLWMYQVSVACHTEEAKESKINNIKEEIEKYLADKRGNRNNWRNYIETRIYPDIHNAIENSMKRL